MKKNIIYIGCAVLVSACAPTLQTYDLNEEYATTLHYQAMSKGQGTEEEDEGESLTGVPALSFYGGDLKRGAIWWAGKGMMLQKGDVFTLTANNVGPDTIPFGATFPPLDLVVEKVFIKVMARAESSFGEAPTVYLQVDDANGNQGNGKRPSQKIEISTEFKEYYFDARDIYVQERPKKRKVNGAMINSVKFFINPGATGFTGKIFIKEIKVVPASQVENK